MLKLNGFSRVLLAALLSISFVQTVNAEPTATLTVVVKGISSQKGEICMGIYSRAKGFPMSTEDVLKSACVQPQGNTLTHIFSGLKPGTYAVAVVDDQNGDRKLNKDFIGIPKEGFGLSRNPTVSIATGTPSFYDASFILMQNQNTKINILMKYSLDS
ncbi:DUF2141 domain-containing protein [Nodularia sp. UHCC 0506]|uniref:DUF2141 domain-containing protein n=1 Tax=Nodularia sp. UHCC 0506 TaxID=3110243 RepID=UPI002B1F294A|nr:DUF2141 domain-containing protein [Nodularia sp. UHCC 0506]MEA5516029.1 DUF2141 domain-containing protein [Nodularia sp. UHCC 0506]